jgi:hypothetical protein
MVSLKRALRMIWLMSFFAELMYSPKRSSFKEERTRFLLMFYYEKNEPVISLVSFDASLAN